MFLQVALHELLGHGSGRLFNEIPEFPNPFTNEPFTTYYQQNETYPIVFAEIGSLYEECRADSTGLFLGTFEDIQEVLLPKFTQ